MQVGYSDVDQNSKNYQGCLLDLQESLQDISNTVSNNINKDWKSFVKQIERVLLYIKIKQADVYYEELEKSQVTFEKEPGEVK